MHDIGNKAAVILSGSGEADAVHRHAVADPQVR